MGQHYHMNHLAEDIRRREEIQLLEGPVLSPFALAVLASLDTISFEPFPFAMTAEANEVDGMCALLIIYRIK